MGLEETFERLGRELSGDREEIITYLDSILYQFEENGRDVPKEDFERVVELFARIAGRYVDPVNALKFLDKQIGRVIKRHSIMASLYALDVVDSRAMRQTRDHLSNNSLKIRFEEVVMGDTRYVSSGNIGKSTAAHWYPLDPSPWRENAVRELEDAS